MNEQKLNNIAEMIKNSQFVSCLLLFVVCQIKYDIQYDFSMPYNEAVVHESVRHFMGRTFGVPHRAVKDTSLAGYYIPEVSCFYQNCINDVGKCNWVLTYN